MGSGFVVDTKGDIVTNEHVIDGATTIKVTFSDGTKATGNVLGSDKATDLAVVRVSGVAASKPHPRLGVKIEDGTSGGVTLAAVTASRTATAKLGTAKS